MRLSIISGANLSNIVVECNYYLKLSDKYKNTQFETFLLMCRETAKILMNKSEADEKVTERALKNSIPSETLYFHRVIQSYWIGHSERCHHYAEKLLQTSDGRHHKTIIMFYRGLNAFQMMKRSNASKHKITARNALDAMKSAATHSKWNYRNKFLLLEAETLSFGGKQEEARSAYAAAITASRSSRFVHEQALACELAGFHYKKLGNNEKACDFFNHAKKLYTEWGSTMKADSVSRQTDLLQK